MITFTLDLIVREFVQRTTTFNLMRKDYDAFIWEFGTRSAQRHEAADSIESMAHLVQEDIIMAAELHAKRRMARRKVFPPWWSPELTRARKDVRSAARQITTAGDRQLYNKKRNKYSLLLRNSKVASWRKFCTLEGKPPWGKLYRLLKGGKAQTMVGLMRRPDGKYCRNIDESVFTLLNELIPNDPFSQEDRRPELADGNIEQFTEPQLKVLAWGIAPNRAPGIDCITGSMLRLLWPFLAPRLCNIVNKCLKTATFPNCWKTAQVVPILKGRDRDIRVPKSYWPVSLLPVLGKVVEKAINCRLREQVATRLSGKQYGFTQGRSTMEAIQNLLTWSDLNSERYVISIFLDISGAFDNLTWPALQRDLANLGANEVMSPGR